MHDVQRHADHLGQTDRAIRRLALDRRRARQRMPFGAGDALDEHFFLQLEHQLAVLRVHGRQCTEFERAAKAVHEYLVVAHDGVLVRHEVLEALHAVFVRERAHVAMHALVPPGHGDVEGVVARGLLRPLAPLVECIQQGLLWVWNHEIDDAGRAAGEARRCAAVEVVASDRPHERQLHMRVRIDAARDDEQVARIDHLRARRRIELGADRRNFAIDAEHVGAITVRGIDDGAAADQDGHDLPPNFFI